MEHQIGNFVVTQLSKLDEIQCTMIELTHLPTGAAVIHLENDDPENFFCLCFQTVPTSSNGVAHILEHTVLCGSKKYPVKDPFFHMTRRSLNTFMNAFTGSDFTCYPAASMIKNDFYNLLEVYLDSVFYPNLTKESFLQEGYRFEFETADDPSSPLKYKGIVYNEMKGAMASSDTRLVDTMHELLYPESPYGYNSGGEPKEIPSLTHEELIAFYEQHYHPSRCIFFFYGNLSLREHLAFIEEKVLSHVTKKDPLPPIPLQPRFKEPKRVERRYPFGEEGKVKDKTMISFGWLTCSVKEQEDLLALSIINTALFGNDASPIKHALLQSKLCKQVSSHVETETADCYYMISLRGCQETQADKLEELIRFELQRIVENGIPHSLIENALHQNEIMRCEISASDEPYGLTLFFRSGLLKMHGIDPKKGLLIHSLFSKLRHDIATRPNYITDLIVKYLLDNPHFVRLTFIPDKELATKEHTDEMELLEQIKSKLTEEEKSSIVKNALDLEVYQQSQDEQNDDVLPKITLADVPLKTKEYPLQVSQEGTLKVFHHDVFTNGLIYADLVFPLPELGNEELSLLNLFTMLLPEIGCGGRNYRENLEYLQANIGKVSADISINIQAKDYEICSPYLYIRGKALERKVDKLFTLLKEVATSADFTDVKRIEEVILKIHTLLEQNLTRSALKYAINLSASSLTVPYQIMEEVKGLSYFLKIRDLALNFDSRKEWLIAGLQSLQKKLLLLQEPHLVLGCESKVFEQLRNHQFYGLGELPLQPYQKWKGNLTKKQLSPQGLTIASPVAFIAEVFQTVPYIHPSSAALSIVAHIFTNVTIHKLVREKGGAYGGGASHNALGGSFYFYSYRDPNISLTMEAFEVAVKSIESGNFDDDDIDEAKLEVIQSLDTPLSPGLSYQTAYRRLREGLTAEERQKFRERLLTTTKEDIIHAVKEFVIPNLHHSKPVVFAGKELLEKENEKLLKDHKEAFAITVV